MNLAVSVVVVAAAIGTLQNVPVRTLGTPEATLPHEFERVRAIRELPDGRTVLTDLQGSRLLIADWRNGSLIPLSRRGEGPSEYSSLGELVAAGGDTTLMLSASRGRWLVLNGGDVSGSILRTAPAVALQRHYFRGVLGTDGARLLVTGNPPVMSSSYEVGPADSLPVISLDRGTARMDTLARIRRAPLKRVVSPGLEPGELFSHTIDFAYARGESAVLCRDGWIAVLRLEPYRIDWRSPQGSWTLGRPIPHNRVRVTQIEKDAYTKRFLTLPPGMAAMAAMIPKDQMPEPIWPVEIPPVAPGALHCTPDGRVLVPLTLTADRQYPLFDVIDRRGIQVERLSLKENERLIGFGAKSLYIGAKDSLDIEQLRRYSYPLR